MAIFVTLFFWSFLWIPENVHVISLYSQRLLVQIKHQFILDYIFRLVGDFLIVIVICDYLHFIYCCFIALRLWILNECFSSCNFWLYICCGWHWMLSKSFGCVMRWLDIQNRSAKRRQAKKL